MLLSRFSSILQNTAKMVDVKWLRYVMVTSRIEVKRVPSLFAPGLAPWNFCSLALSLPGLFAPRNESFMELSLRGIFVSWNFRSLNVYLTVCVYRPKRFKLVSVNRFACNNWFRLNALIN